MPKVTVIPPKINPSTHQPIASSGLKRRVAGYARVSTDSDEQFTSYSGQIDYYTKRIKSNPEWSFVKVYTDEGISGLNTKKRTGFNEMIKDALDGEIDLIITKSVSRFARNTVDSLVTIRKLKDKGVECYFEKENIYTMDSKGELLITIMSSLAQEESRSISENVTWGQRKSFSDGKVHLAYSSFLGYRKNEGGKIEIVEDEAKTIRLIYSLFIGGKTPASICGELEGRGIKTPRGLSKWRQSTVLSILKNEKYKGDALLQKRFTVDFLEKKLKKNEGEVPQYYVHNSHPAIISPDDWESVQLELAKRASLKGYHVSTDMFLGKVKCGACGASYGPKVWHSTSDKYRRVIYQCDEKFSDGKKRCSTPHLSEGQIKELFLKAYNSLGDRKESVVQTCDLIISELSDTKRIDDEINDLGTEIDVVSEKANKMVGENAFKAQSQDEYLAKYNALCQRYDSCKKKVDELNEEKVKNAIKAQEIADFRKTVESHGEAITEWDQSIWNAALEEALVHSDNTIEFRFYSGVSFIEKII